MRALPTLSTLRRVFTILALTGAAHVLMGASCKVDEYEADIWDLTRSFQRGASYVDYADEGRIFLLDNHCEAWPDSAPVPPPSSTDCPTPLDPMYGAVEGCPLTYKPPAADGSGLFGPSSCGERELSMSEAQLLLRQHRWIDVNPSFTSLDTAKVLAWSKLIDRYGFHEEGERVRGVLLVYLPMGPEYDNVAWETVAEDQDRFDEVLRTMCGKYPVDHPVFQDTLDELIDGATVRSEFDDSIVITSNSYSAHQVLDVIKWKSNVFWYDIAPTIGAFTVDGDLGYSGLCELFSCTGDNIFDGYVNRHSCDPNHHVHDWVNNLRISRVTQCMLVSRGDCLSQYHYGAALAWEEGDPAEDLTPANSCSINMNPEHDRSYAVDADADPGGDAYWDDPVDEDLVLDLETLETSIGPGGTSRLWYATEQVRAKHGLDREMEWYYWSPEATYEAIWTNLDERPGSLKIQLVKASGAGPEGCSDEDNTRRACDDPRTADADHFEFYDIGVADAWTDTGPYNFMWDEFENCPSLWEGEDCPECAVADEVAHGRFPADDMLLSYFRRAGWTDRVLPINDVRDRDVIYLPPEGAGVAAHGLFESNYERLRLRYEGSSAAQPGQYHLSAWDDIVGLRADIYSPDDTDHDDEVTDVHLTDHHDTYTVVHDAAMGDPERRQYTYYEDWQFHELADPAGRYADLAGAWFDLGGGYTSIDPQSGERFDGTARDSRVLVMRSQADQDGWVFPRPVPDVTSISLPDEVSSLDVPWISVGAFSVLDETPSVTIQAITAADPDPDPINTWYEGLTYETDAGDGHQYMTEWDVLQTWCRAYPWDGAMCGGAPSPFSPGTLEVTLRARAANGEGNTFWAEQTVTVYRDGSLDTYTCDGFCGLQAPTGCWCDGACSWFMDCCPDKAELCGGDEACAGEPWCD